MYTVTAGFFLDRLQSLVAGAALTVDGEHIDLWKGIQAFSAVRYRPVEISGGSLTLAFFLGFEPDGNDAADCTVGKRAMQRAAPEDVVINPVPPKVPN